MSSIAFGSPKSQLITDFSHQMLKVDQNLKIHENLKISPVFPNYPIFFKFCIPILSSPSISFLEKISKFQNFGAPNGGVKGQFSKFYSIAGIYSINRTYIQSFIEICWMVLSLAVWK
jgi:hypothetical protein